MRNFHRILILLALTGCTPSPGDRAESVATEYWNAIGSTDWDTVVRLTHSESLAEIKEIIIAGVEDLPARADIPPQMIYMNSMEDVLDGMEIDSAQDLRAMSPEEVFQRLILQEKDGNDAVISILRGAENDTEGQIIGHIPESDTLIHVVRRSTFIGNQPQTQGTTDPLWKSESKMDVLTLRLDNGEWKTWRSNGLMMRLAVGSMLKM